jgi:hypothetical protein
MRTLEWAKKHYRLIFDFIWLAIIIVVIFKFYVGRQWCFNLVKPYFDKLQDSISPFNPPNTTTVTNFENFLQTFNQTDNKSSCKCP